MTMHRGSWSLAFVLAAALAARAGAEVEVTTVAAGLTNPCGLAIQPGTGHLFVSDSGAGRIVRIELSTGKVEDVITGFKQDVYGKGPMYDIGPLGLAFLDANTLVVGGGDLPDGEELLRMYYVPPAGTTLGVKDTCYVGGPIEPGEASAKGEGNFYDLAVTAQGIYITSNGDDNKGWVLRVPLVDGKPGKLEPFIATKEATGVNAPVGIAVDAEGRLVVGQMGAVNLPGDSLLTVYDEASGKLVSSQPTGLNDIAAVAYSPKGRLYVLDYAWLEPSAGGLFRLDVNSAAVQPTKVVGLDKPTAMVFGPDGALYVTVFGTAADDSTQGSGKVVKITGDL